MARKKFKTNIDTVVQTLPGGITSGMYRDENADFVINSLGKNLSEIAYPALRPRLFDPIPFDLSEDEKTFLSDFFILMFEKEKQYMALNNCTVTPSETRPYISRVCVHALQERGLILVKPHVVSYYIFPSDRLLKSLADLGWAGDQYKRPATRAKSPSFYKHEKC
jgi:hypothetical protein